VPISRLDDDPRNGTDSLESRTHPLKLVLDTNAAIDWLVFDDPAMRPIVRGIEAGGIVLVSDTASLGELERALGYAEFRLDAAAQAQRVAKYRAHAVPCPESDPDTAALPVCSDPDDQMFLELAARSGAALLVTRDKALLRLARRLDGRFHIATPAAVSGAYFPAEG